MVRWKNRTPEDKERVLREQKEMQLKADTKKNPYALLNVKATENRAGEIYKRFAIPIPCPLHGWVESEKYELVRRKHILTGDELIDILKGNCPDCRKEICRAFPMGDEILLFLLAASQLKKAGRLEDKRGI